MPAEITEALALAAPGWPVSIAETGIRVAQSSPGFRVSGDSIDRVADDAWEAAHWVLATAIGARAEATAGGLVLNAGACLLGGHAVVLAGESHAGKSSIALHLAALGTPLLGDDRLILETAAAPPVAVGLGLARKVRTPVPVDFSEPARRLAASARRGHAAGADVLAWDPAVDRPAGTTAPIARILVLHRDSRLAAARVVGLGAAEAVAALLPLCGRNAGSAAELLDAVAALASRVPVRRLEAPNSAAAAAALPTLSGP